MRDISTVLKYHRQMHEWSCAASAHEFIAKIHGKINLTDYPLQLHADSQKAGFQFEAFLNSIEFTGQDHHLNPDDAVTLFVNENAQQRFPLVSILSGLGSDFVYWHIVVAIPSGRDVGLVDPAKQIFITHTTAETLAHLKATVDAVPGRDKNHILAYREHKDDVL